MHVAGQNNPKNLKSHLRRHHEKFFEEIKQEAEARKDKKRTEVMDATGSYLPSSGQGVGSDPFGVTFECEWIFLRDCMYFLSDVICIVWYNRPDA
jgi:hypothetical protein